MEKAVVQKDIVNIDYRKLKNKMLNKLYEHGEERYQYSIERKRGIPHIVENNFKPNTKTAMSIPCPVYNEFVDELSKRITAQGLKANDLMPLFVQIYAKYRRNYLGILEDIKPSSYMRYSAVLYLFWKVTEGKMGFTAELFNQHIVKTVEVKGNNVSIDSEVMTRGYYIKPAEYPIVRIIDTEQMQLLSFE